MKKEFNLFNQFLFEIITLVFFYFFDKHFILSKGIKKALFFLGIGIAIEIFFKSFAFVFHYFGELTKKDKKLMEKYVKIMSILACGFSIFMLILISFTFVINVKDIIFDKGNSNTLYSNVLLMYIPLFIKSKAKRIPIK